MACTQNFCVSRAALVSSTSPRAGCVSTFCKRLVIVSARKTIQKAVAAWDSAPGNRIMVSLLLPGPMEMDQWLKEVRTCINMWPLQKTEQVVTNQMATDVFMRRERRRLQARHVWDKIEPVWTKILDRVWIKQPTEESRWLENSYRGKDWRWVQQQWKNCQTWFAKQAVARFPSQCAVSLWTGSA